MTENVDTVPREEKLSFQEVDGRFVQWVVRCDSESGRNSSGLRSSRIISATGRVAVKRSAVNGDAAAYAELDREVHAGLRLVDRYGVQHGPTELAGLIGYNLDCREPFVIVSPVRGQPIGELGQLRPDAREAFQISLLRGLASLAAAGVVHGDLKPSTVYWDGSAVQIRDFGQAAVRTERSSGPAVDDAARDIWSAGELILRTATGRSGLAGDSALAGRGEALRELLAGVFDEAPGRRPTAADLLDRLNTSVRLPPEDRTAKERFVAGQRVFDQTLQAKRPRGVVAAPVQPPAPNRARVRLLMYCVVTVVTVVLGLVALVVVR